MTSSSSLYFVTLFAIIAIVLVQVQQSNAAFAPSLHKHDFNSLPSSSSTSMFGRRRGSIYNSNSNNNSDFIRSKRMNMNSSKDSNNEHEHSSLLRKKSTSSTSTSTSLQAKKNNQNDSSLSMTQNDDENEMGTLALFSFVIPLLLVYISNQWSRSSLYYLVDFSSASTSASAVADTITTATTEAAATTAASFYAMNLDIGFDQAQYGALASIAFTTLFAITSLFAGSLADNYNRKYLTVGSTIVWAIATYTTSVASTYDEILISRIVMGLACAFTTPCAYTLLKDNISNSKLSFANSIYGSGVYFGGGLSSLSILLDENYGWRNTMGIISGYGFAVALLSTLILSNDPKQSASDVIETPQEKQKQLKRIESNNSDTSTSTSNSFFDEVKDIASSNKRIQYLFAGSFVRFCSGLCIGVWAAPYYKLAFPTDASSYAVINALIVGVCGVSSGLLGGYISDKSIGLVNGSNDESSSDGSDNQLFSLSSLDENGARLIVPIIGSLLAVPAWWLTSHASTFDAAMTWLAIEYLVAECWFGPTVAVLQSEVKKGQGGVAQGLFTLTGAVGNLAPSLLGILYSRQVMGDAVPGAGSDVLSTLLGVGVCSGYLLSAIFFGLSAVTPTSTKSNMMKSA